MLIVNLSSYRYQKARYATRRMNLEEQLDLGDCFQYQTYHKYRLGHQTCIQPLCYTQLWLDREGCNLC